MRLAARISVFAAISLAVLATALAVAVAWGPHHCELQFPKIIGCAIGSYESLTSGIVAAAAALIAGWLAWTAVQLQIEAEERRTAADAVEVERLFRDDFDWMTEGLAGIWRVVDTITNAPEDDPATKERLEGVRYGLEILTRPSRIGTARKMAECLQWDRRRRYERVFESLERVAGEVSGEQTNWFEVLRAIHDLADDIEGACPECAKYFEGFWRRSHKAWSLGYAVEVTAGLHRPANAETEAAPQP